MFSGAGAPSYRVLNAMRTFSQLRFFVGPGNPLVYVHYRPSPSITRPVPALLSYVSGLGQRLDGLHKTGPRKPAFCVWRGRSLEAPQFPRGSSPWYRCRGCVATASKIGTRIPLCSSPVAVLGIASEGMRVLAQATPGTMRGATEPTSGRGIRVERNGTRCPDAGSWFVPVSCWR
jgi:hypothetical protein